MLEKYTNYLLSSDKEYSQYALKTYKNNVSKFLQWLGERYNEKNPGAVTLLDIREYQCFLLNVKIYSANGLLDDLCIEPQLPLS